MQKSAIQFFDEMRLNTADVREIYSAYNKWLQNTPHQQLATKRAEAEVLFRRVGIPFNVYVCLLYTSSAGNAGGTRTAIGLNHVAIQMDTCLLYTSRCV